MERLRRTMMFVHGANAAMLRDAPLYGADSIMFDLEDAVSLKKRLCPCFSPFCFENFRLWQY